MNATPMPIETKWIIMSKFSNSIVGCKSTFCMIAQSSIISLDRDRLGGSNQL